MMDGTGLVTRGSSKSAIHVNQGNLRDPAFQYMRLLFGEMDPESIFTFMMEEDAADMLTFNTEQMLAKHGIKEFGTMGREAIMKELEQLMYHKAMEG